MSETETRSGESLEDLTRSVTAMGLDLKEYQRTLDERLKRVEEGGFGGEHAEKIKGLEEILESRDADKKALDELRHRNEEMTAALERLEAAAARPAAGVEGGDDRRWESRAWDHHLELRILKGAEAGGEMPDRRQMVNEYREAFDNYMRRGAVRGDLNLQERSLRVGDDTEAGYLAPPEFDSEIIKSVQEYSPFRMVARVRPVNSKSLVYNRRTGVPEAVWVGEGQTTTETEGLEYGRQEIVAHLLRARIDLSYQLLQDAAINVESEANMEMSEAFGRAEGKGFINGDGKNGPTGVLQETGIAESKSGSGTGIAADSLFDLVHGIPTEYSRNSKFIMNRKTIAAIRKLKDTAGQYVFQHEMLLIPGAMPTILGYEYAEMPDMPNIAAGAFPVVWGDFMRAYTIVDRNQTALLRDPYSNADKAMISFYAFRRVGGRVVHPEAIIKLKIAA